LLEELVELFTACATCARRVGGLGNGVFLREQSMTIEFKTRVAPPSHTLPVAHSSGWHCLWLSGVAGGGSVALAVSPRRRSSRMFRSSESRQLRRTDSDHLAARVESVC